MSINYKGKKCSCGNEGCFERYVCEQGFLEIAHKYIPNCHTIDEVFHAPSDIVEKIINKYVFYLGKGLRNLVFIFDPSCIIIGGFVAHYWDRFNLLINEEIYKNNHIYEDIRSVRIIKAKFKEDTSLIGAGLLPFYGLFYEDDVFS